jgi:CMD domain protein
VTDVIDELAGSSGESALRRLRDQRPDVVRYAQGSYLALLEPEHPAGVSRAERELVALRVAVLERASELAERHRERLRALDAPEAFSAAGAQFPAGPELPERAQALLRFVDRLTLEPRAATQQDIGQLQAAGLSARDVVTIAQLIAYLSFQIRVVAGLRALASEEDR